MSETNQEIIMPDNEIWSQENVKKEILAQVKAVAEMLIEKNKKYGNSAIQPKRIFSKASPVEQINVRIDDKLSRIANQQINEDEDAEFDLIGYLILKRVFNNLTEKATKGQQKCKHCGKYSREKDFIYDNRIEVKNVQTYSDCGYGDDDRFGDVEFEIKYAKCPKCGKEHEISRFQRRILWEKRRGE